MSPKPTPSWWALVALAAVVAAALRLPALDAQALWYDEVYSLDMSTWPLSIVLTVRDGHPPLYHLLLMVAGPLLGETAGRVVSAVIGIATVPLIALLGARFFDARTGVWAAFLLAVSPLHVWYSREGRMYALYVAFAVLSSLAIERVVRSGKPRHYVAWAAAALGGLLTHYGFAAVAAVQTVFVAAAVLRRHRARALVPIAAVAVLAVAVMAPLAREVAAGPLGTQRGFNALALPYTALTFVGGFGVGPPLSALHWSRGADVLRPYSLEIGGVVVVAAVLAAMVARSLPSAPRSWSLYLTAWLLVPAVLLAARSATSGTAHNVRYVLGSLPAFVLIVAFALRRHERTAAGAVLALWLVLGGVSMYRDRFDPRYGREDVRAAGAYLRDHVHPGDRIVVTTEYQRRTLRYYLRSRREIEKLPVLQVDDPGDARTAMAPWLHGGRRTWVVFTREWDEDPSHLLRDAMDGEPRADAVARFPGVAIYRLEPLIYGSCLVPSAEAGEKPSAAVSSARATR